MADSKLSLPVVVVVFQNVVHGNQKY